MVEEQQEFIVLSPRGIEGHELREIGYRGRRNIC